MTQYNPHIHNRRSIRLKGYDYSQAGLYFITICCKNKACLFGHITNVGAKYLSPADAKHLSPADVKNISPADVKNISPADAKNISPSEPKQMILNDAGKIANECWLDIPNHFQNVILHDYIIMPNHVHGIIELIETNRSSNDNSSNDLSPKAENGAKNVSLFNDDSSNDLSPQAEKGAKNVSPLRSPSQTIGSVIRGFKIGVTKWMRQNTNIHDVWQRNYYEHIIQNQQSYFHISEYIKNNPSKWNKDKFYVQ